MADELIINLCPTGMVPTRAETPHVPLTPDEVAADVRRCADLGVSIVHVHPRDEAGAPTQSVARAREFLAAIRDRGAGRDPLRHDQRPCDPDLEPRVRPCSTSIGPSGPRWRA